MRPYGGQIGVANVSMKAAKQMENDFSFEIDKCELHSGYLLQCDRFRLAVQCSL